MRFLQALLVFAALAGLLGQTTARAMPMRTLSSAGVVAAEMADCHQQATHAGTPAREMPQSGGDGEAPFDCQGAADCVGPSGCGVVPFAGREGGLLARPVEYGGPTYPPAIFGASGVTLRPELLPPRIG